MPTKACYLPYGNKRTFSDLMEATDQTKEPGTLPDVEMAEILRLSFRAMKHLPGYALITLIICILPSLLLIWLLPDGPARLPVPSYPAGLQTGREFLMVLAVELTALLTCGAIAAMALQWRRQGNISIIACLFMALQRWPLLILNAAVINLAIFGLWNVMRWPENIWLFMVLNILCIILICMLVAKFILFIPVIIGERGSLLAGLARSRFLTQGYAGQAFLLSLVMTVLTAALCWLCFSLGQLGELQALTGPRSGDVSWVSSALTLIFVEGRAFWLVLWSTLGGIFWMVSMTMLYCRLCELKENGQPCS